MPRESRSKQARRQTRDVFGRFAAAPPPAEKGTARRAVRGGGRTASMVSRTCPRSESGNGKVGPALHPSETVDGGYIDLVSSDEERYSSSQGPTCASGVAPEPSRATGDARLRRPQEAGCSKPRRKSISQKKKGAVHEGHHNVTATGGKQPYISDNYEWSQFYGMYLEAVKENKVLQEELAKAKKKNNELTIALAEVKKKKRSLKHALAAARWSRN